MRCGHPNTARRHCGVSLGGQHNFAAPLPDPYRNTIIEGKGLQRFGAYASAWRQRVAGLLQTSGSTSERVSRIDRHLGHSLQPTRNAGQRPRNAGNRSDLVVQAIDKAFACGDDVIAHFFARFVVEAR
jgi:hypothetical protein